MIIIRKLQVCPYCESVTATRLMRLSWMRLFSDGRHYECEVCGKKYFLFMKRFSLGLSLRDPNRKTTR